MAFENQYEILQLPTNRHIFQGTAIAYHYRYQRMGHIEDGLHNMRNTLFGKRWNGHTQYVRIFDSLCGCGVLTES